MARYLSPPDWPIAAAEEEPEQRHYVPALGACVGPDEIIETEVELGPPFVAVDEDGNPIEPSDATFDPAAHKVDEVLGYIAGHPDEAAAALEAERGGKARKSLIEALEQLVETSEPQE